MQVRTGSAVLVWVAVALLIIDIYLRSDWLFLMSIALILAAIVIYFIPVLYKRESRKARADNVHAHWMRYSVELGENRVIPAAAADSIQTIFLGLL